LPSAAAAAAERQNSHTALTPALAAGILQAPAFVERIRAFLFIFNLYVCVHLLSAREWSG